MVTDYVEGVSKSYIKNPDYWGFDEKYPGNRLPYSDQLRALLMPEEATRISALRTGQIEKIQHAGVVDIQSLDVIRSLQMTNPKIEDHSYFQAAFASFSLNIRNAPFDAMQSAPRHADGAQPRDSQRDLLERFRQGGTHRADRGQGV